MTTDNPAAPAVDGAPTTPALVIPSEAQERAPAAPAEGEKTTPASPAAADAAKPEETDGTTPPAGNEGDSEQQDEAEKKAPKVRFHERISQLVNDRKRVEAERDAALMELQRLQQPLRPQNYDDLDYETQQRITTQEAVNAAMAQQAYSRAEFLHQQAASTVHATFQAKVEAAREQLPDFDSVFNAGVPVTDTMAELIAESERAPQVAYWLGKNPHEAARIASLPAHRQGAELVRIEARVSPPSQARKVSKAPEPPPRVGTASSAVGVKDPGSMSAAEIQAMLFRPK